MSFLIQLNDLCCREKDLEAKFIIQMEKSKTTITNLKASNNLALLSFHESPCVFCQNDLWVSTMLLPFPHSFKLAPPLFS